MIEYKIKDRATYPTARFSGYVQELYQRVIEARMTSDFAVNEILAEAEAPFFTRNDDEKAPAGFWRGEFWGKWIISAVRACQYEKNEKLEGIIRNSVYKLLSTADENGYIGSYKDPSLVLPCDRAEARRVLGYSCNFCWNIWCQKYTLWGLLEAYELLGDENILLHAHRAANQLIDVVDALGVNPCDTGTFRGVASGSILKPMLILYRHTGDDKVLRFATDIVNGFKSEGTYSLKIIEKTLSGVPVHLWNNHYIESGKNRMSEQKAYEMMSCFEGVCEYYRVTGDEVCFTAAKRFYDLIIDFEYNRLLCVGFNDRFLYASSIEDALSEPCDVLHFLRLTGDLYRLTGDVRYMDYYEGALLNPFLACFTRDGSWAARAVRSMSYHITERDIVDMKYNHCCVNNVPRGFEHAAQAVAAQNESSIALNLYLPATVTLDGASIKISDGYMRASRITVSIELSKDTPISFRIPAWSKSTELLLDGKAQTVSAGSYYTVALSAGTHTVEIQFDSTPRVEYAYNDRDMFPMTAFLKKRYDLLMPAESTKGNMATVSVGPMLLSMTTQLGTSWQEMIERKTVNMICKSCVATPTDHANTICSYDITVETTDGHTETIPMCDYVTASNRFIPEDFSIFI